MNAPVGCRLIETAQGRAIICRIRTEDEIAASFCEPDPTEEEMREWDRVEEARMLLEESRAEAEMSPTDRARLQLLVGLGYLDAEQDLDLADDSEPDFDDHDLDEDGLPLAEHEAFSWPLGMSIIPAGRAVPGMHGFTGPM